MEHCKVLWLSVLLIAWPSAFAQTVAVYVEDQLLHNVVIVEGARNDGVPINGAGMIMGRSGDLLWIATAGHVVFQEKRLLSAPGKSPVKTLRVKFRNGTSWEAAGPPESTMLDLAFFPVKVPFDLAGPDLWRENVEILRPEAGTAVRLAARPNQIAYGDSGATITNIDAAGNIVIRNLHGSPGQSGAPVATSDGFVGMYLKSAGERVLPMSSIKQEAERSGRPYQLHPPPAKANAVRLCLIQTGAYRHVPGVSGRGGLRRPDKDGCVDAWSGTNRLAPDPWISCRPEQFELSPLRRQTLEIACSISPHGTWRWQGKQDTFVEIMKVSDTLWSIEGISTQFGPLTGALRSTQESFTLDLRMPNGLQVRGVVTLAPRRMSGELSGTAGQVTLDLVR